MTPLTVEEVFMSHSQRPRLVVALMGLLPATAYAQTLETETARFHPARSFQIASGFEHQFSAEGRESAVPVALEYALTNTWELLVEPVPYTTIRPKVGPHATGLGDLEVTVIHLVWSETGGRPAVALAGEVKVPTAESRLIGTDKTDYTGYLIASRRFGALDLHANLGYTVVGKPAGISVQNLIDFALGGTVPLGPKAIVYGEILGNTSAAGGLENSAAPEIAGGELSGTIGFGGQVSRNLLVSLGVSYDNTQAVLLRPGFTLRLH
jgi:hypothetical protein